MAIIAVDSSGIVGQPPVYFVAARLKYRRGKIDYKSQRHHLTTVDKELHDSFINKAQEWRLKLSAVLIYCTMISLVHEEDQILIDVDFDPSNRRIIKRYLNKLLFTYHRETPLQQRPIEFRSVKEDECIRIADSKTKNARRKAMSANEQTNESTLNQYFDILKKIK